MATPKVLLKRSSVIGRVPGASDLDYGELAINFADGKIYYKDDSNNIKAFIDSARVQEIADAVEVVADAQLDSGETTILVTSLIDSNYVQSRTNEAYLATIIDSDYVQARQADIFRDSAFITNTIAQNLDLGEFILGLDPGVDPVQNPSNFVTILAAKLTAGNGIILSGGTEWTDNITITADVIDSSTVEAIVDSAYIQARQNSVGEAGVDSAGVVTIIGATVDSTYVQTRQSAQDFAYGSLTGAPTIPSFGTDYIDSATASAIITADVTKSFVDALGTNADTLDGFEGTHYLQYSNLTGAPITQDSAMIYRYTIDSARTTQLVDSAYVRARVRTNQDLRTSDTVEFSGMTISGDFNVTGTTTSVNTIVYTTNDPLIHLADSNEQSDLVDIGHIGHYYGNGQRRHTGVFRDASNEEYYIFNNMVDSAFDSVLPPNVINRNATDFQLSTLNVGTLRGVYAGFDSDFNAKSTTNLSEGSNLYYTKARADSDIAASLNDSTNTVSITINNTITDQVDSAYVLDRVAEAPFLDSTTVLGVIDQTYVRNNQIKYNTSDFTDSAFVTGLPVSTFTNDANYLDSTTVTGVISQTYVRNNQIQYNTSDFADSAFVTGQGYLTTATTTALVDSAYVQLRQVDGNKSLNGLKAIQFIHDSDAATYTVTVASKDASHRYEGTGSASGYKIDGIFSPTIVMNPGNTYRFDMSDATNSSHPINFYYDAAKTTQYTTNVLNNYASKAAGVSGSYVEITVTDDTPSVLHYQCGNHGYMGGMIQTQTRNLTGFTTDDLTEGSTNLYYTNTRVSTLVDATYVQDRQTKYNTSDFADSAFVTAQIATIDSAYVQARQSGGEITIQEEGTPLSNAATTLNFVGTGVTATGTGTTKTITISGGGSGTVDSADIIAIVDSNYVQARQLVTEGVTELDQTTFYYTAAAGDSTFSGNDDFGNTLDYSAGKVQVFINGILQVKTSDFTANNGTSVSLVEAADSGDIIAIETITGNTANTRLQLDTYVYTADSGDNNFGGADDNNKTLDYSAGKIQVFLNGILLLDSDDYTATNGLNILTDSLDSGDVLTIQQFTGTNIGIDSTQTRQLIDSAYIQARQSASGITVQEEGVSLSTAGTTLNFVGSSVTASGTGATKTITVTAASGGTDSAATIALIDDQLAIFSVGDLVGADGNPGDMLVSDGDGTASWTGNGALTVEFKVNYDSLGVISTVTDLPTGFTHDSTSGNTIIVSHNTGRSVKDITYNSYVSGTLKLRRPSADSADIVTYSVADRLNKFTANVSQATTGADADQYAWVNITF